MMRAMSKLDPTQARALAGRAWQAVSSGDVAALEALCTEQIVWHASGRGSHAGDHHGREGVLAYLAGVGEDVLRFDAELQDVLVGDTTTAILLRASGRRDARALDTSYVVLLRFEADRIAEVWSIPQDQHAVDAFWA
jgi:ketosteroid isomerase-like protein